MINLPHTQVKEKPGLKGLIAEFYWTFQEQTLILLKPFTTTEREGILLISSNEVSITLILKSEKEKELWPNIPDELYAKILS